VVRALLKAGADGNVTENDGETPMYVAAGEGYVGVMTELRASGEVGLEGETREGETPIFAATRAGRGRSAAWLQVNGANVNRASNDGQGPLFIVAEVGALAIAMTLAALGGRLDALGANKLTPLIIASLRGRRQVVQALG
jgi:ankyrin repeat protein